MSKKHRDRHGGGVPAQPPASSPEQSLPLTEEERESPDAGGEQSDEAEPAGDGGEGEAGAPEAETARAPEAPVVESDPVPAPVVAAPAPAIEEAVLTDRPTHDELLAAIAAGKSVEVAVLPPLARGKIAGLPVTREPQVFPLLRVVHCGPSYVRALAIDERIHVRIVETPEG